MRISFFSRVSPNCLADELHRAKTVQRTPGDLTTDYLADGLPVIIIIIIIINHHPSPATTIDIMRFGAGGGSRPSINGMISMDGLEMAGRPWMHGWPDIHGWPGGGGPSMDPRTARLPFLDIHGWPWVLQRLLHRVSQMGYSAAATLPLVQRGHPPGRRDGGHLLRIVSPFACLPACLFIFFYYLPPHRGSHV